MQVFWINVHVRGAGKTAAAAYGQAVTRLEAAAEALANENVVVDEGTRVAMDDPGGGGGGPCAPEYISIEVNVTAAGLPEAKSRDDD